MLSEARGAGRLLAGSVAVTGTHYSMTTLAGRIIAASGAYAMVHEPLNHRPTLGYATVPTRWWYHYFAPPESTLLAQRLGCIMAGRAVSGRAPGLGDIRSRRDVARLGKRAVTGMARRVLRRRVVFKDPFLCFSIRHLQAEHGLSAVLTLRHPCGFAESLARRGEGFDFSHLLQPALLEALPDHAEEIARHAREPGPVLDQAALLWSVVYGFADRYYARSPRSLILRQEDLVARPVAETERLLAFLGAHRRGRVDRLLAASLAAPARAPVDGGRGGYTRRDARAATRKWQSRLSPAQIERVMARCGDLAARFGYGPAGAGGAASAGEEGHRQ